MSPALSNRRASRECRSSAHFARPVTGNGYCTSRRAIPPANKAAWLDGDQGNGRLIRAA